MKSLKLTISVALVTTLTAGVAIAGSLVEPVVEPEIIVEQASSSSSPGLLPLFFLVVILGAVLGGGRDGPRCGQGHARGGGQAAAGVHGGGLSQAGY